jgi:NADH dehydrogenase FAD-containing subunit
LARASLACAHVTLVAPFLRPIPPSMLAGFVSGHHSVDEGSASLPDLANAANVQFVQAQPTALNVGERTVTLADGRVMGYDILSLDTGPVVNRDAIPGARNRALFVRPIEHFTQLWGGLLQLASERALSVVVLGGDVLALELALALQCRLNLQARVSLVTGGAAPLAGRSLPVQQHARAALKRSGVTLIEDACTEITATHVVLRGGGRLVCDAPIAAWAPDPPTWLAQSGLVLDEHGFVC